MWLATSFRAIGIADDERRNEEARNRKQRELENGREHLRRDDRREDAAERAAKRHPKVEVGQVVSRGAGEIEFAMAGKGGARNSKRPTPNAIGSGKARSTT